MTPGTGNPAPGVAVPDAAARGPAGPPRPAGRRLGRRGRLVAGVVAGALVATGVTVGRVIHAAGGQTVCGADAVQSTAVAGLADFTDWLARNHVPGYVGEVGWPSGPDADQWNAVADRWYDAADRAGLPVTAWAAGPWPASYPLAIYRRAAGASALSVAGPQAGVLREHPGTGALPRGIVLASGSFSAGDVNGGYSNVAPGRYGYDYSYGNSAGFAYLHGQGINLVRLAVTWERLQPRPGGPLSEVEVGRLLRAVDLAERAGIRVVIDLHGYGDYVDGSGGTRRVLRLGSPALPTTALADFWRRVAAATSGSTGIVGYDLMNEPRDLAQHGAAGARLWEQASQQAVDAVRSTGDRREVFVSAFGQDSPAHFADFHPRAWIQDPAHAVVYEAHAYFDADSSGHYARSYAAELRLASATEVPRCETMPRLRDTAWTASTSPLRRAVAVDAREQA